MHDAVTILSIVWSSVTWENIADCSVTAEFSANVVASGQDCDDDDGDDNDDSDNNNNSVGDRQSCDI